MNIKNVIQKNNFHFNKKFGQNFIDDDALLDKIADAAQLTEDDTVLEIGVGAGTLTKKLSDRAKKVVGYEIDRNLQPVLAETLSGVENAEVVFRDFMREKPEEVEKATCGKFTVTANLPYYITSPITMRLLEEFPLCEKIIIMVQKEVAERFTVAPGTKDYGSITAAIDYYGDTEYLFTVGRENFYPVPNVDSAVIRITRRKKYEVISEAALKEVLRISFLSRRKTLANNLINVLKVDRLTAEGILKDADIDISVRGEVLNTQQFINLADVLVTRQILK